MEALALVLGCILVWVGVFGAGKVEQAPRVWVPRANRKSRWRAFLLGTALVLLVVGNADSTRARVRTAIDSLSRPEPTDSAVYGLTTDTTPATPAAVIPAPADTAIAVRADTAPAAADPVPEFGGFRSRVRVTWTLYDVTYVGEMSLTGTDGALLVSYDTSDGVRRKVLQHLTLQRTDRGWFYMGSNPRDPVSQQPSANYQPDFFHLSLVEGEWKFDQACDARACVDVLAEPIS
ncbi:MAG TPA: hypothetical protein VFT45_11190 [Longimicrobium sp.]|nr:hypothetical protein [Longimicrobium sp.]